MEDVLDIYCRPYNEHEPLVCLDEMGKNLVKEKHSSEPAKRLNIAEIKLSVLARQGLEHNIATVDELCEQEKEQAQAPCHF